MFNYLINLLDFISSFDDIFLLEFFEYEVLLKFCFFEVFFFISTSSSSSFSFSSSSSTSSQFSFSFSSSRDSLLLKREFVFDFLRDSKEMKN